MKKATANSQMLNCFLSLSKPLKGFCAIAVSLALVFSSLITFASSSSAVASAEEVSTATVYIDDTGDDSTLDGSIDSPYKTLNAAIAKIGESGKNGTVIVKNYLTIPASDFTWDNHAGVNVTITGGTIDASARSSLYIKDNVTFSNITVKWPTNNDRRVYAMGYKLVIESDVDFGETKIGEIYGGSENSTVASTDLTLRGGQYDYIFGGGRTSASADLKYTGKVTGDTKVLIDGDVKSTYLCGGGCDSIVNGSTNLTVKAGNFNYIFGGGYTNVRDDIDPEISGNTNILIDGNVNPDHLYTNDTNQPAIYGGSKKGTVGGNTNITVKSGNFGFIFGGGADDKNAAPKSKVLGASNIDFAGNAYCLYGGSKYAVGGNADITVRDGANVCQIFGGSENNSAEGNININILGGRIYRRIYGGSYNDYGLFGWTDTNYHVTGNIGVTIMPYAELVLNQGEDKSVYAISRGANTFDGEYGTFVFNEDYYTQNSSKIGPDKLVDNIFSSQAYHYLVKTNGNLADGSLGTVVTAGNSLKITPDPKYMATVTVEGDEAEIFYGEGNYVLPEVSTKEQREITVTFAPKPIPDEIAVYHLGDVNMDKSVNILDLINIKKKIISDNVNGLADLNNDQNVNAEDIIELVHILFDGINSAPVEDNMYRDLAEAIHDKNADGGIIVLKKDISVSSSVRITQNAQNIRILNEPGKDITITRDGDIEMFNVTNTLYSLTLGGLDMTGSLMIDASTSAVADKRVVDNSGTFILGKNATVKNTNFKTWGSVLINRTHEAHLYGNITDNTCSGASGPILQNDNGGKVIFHEGEYSNNSATRAGNNPSLAGLFYVNSGSVEILDGAFAANTSIGYGNVGYVKSGAELTVLGGNFDEEQSIYVDGNADISGNIDGAQFIKGIGTITVSGALTGADITVTPIDYDDKTPVLNKADDIDDSVFAAACAKIRVTPDNNIRYTLDEAGKLVILDFITVDEIPDTIYKTLQSAVEAVSGLSTATVRVNGTVTLSEKLVIPSNVDITITNAVGKDATIKRGKDIVMFDNNGTGRKLTLGSDDEGSLTIDAPTSSDSGNRVIDNGGTFTLGRNATIKNANSSVWGNILINRAGEAHLYGNITDNTCSGACGPILQNTAGGKVIFHEGVYSNNSATRALNNPSLAGLFYVNAGSVEILGGTFEGNTSTGYGNVGYVKSGAKLTVSGGTFGKEQSIYVDGNADISGNIDGAQFIKGTGTITVNDTLTNAKIVVTPNSYDVGAVVLTKAAELDEATFAEVCNKVTVNPNSATQNAYALDNNGALTQVNFTIDGQDGDGYATLAEAVAAAKELSPATIRVNGSFVLSSQITIPAGADITITNAEGKNVIIKRSKDILMFNNASGRKLTLGSDDEGSLTIDASTSSDAATRVIDNGGTFTLGRNATVKNANSTVWGNVLINRAGEAHLYGNITDNTCSGACGPILQNTAGGKVIFHEGVYSNNAATRPLNNPSLAGLFYVNAGSVEILGGTFEGNTSTGYGNVGYVKSGAKLTVSGGTFGADQNIEYE